MKTTVVNFIAAPSVGKSLMSALTFAEIKSRNFSCELIQEYAKTLVWQERFEELNVQYQVSLNQYNMIKAVQNKVQFAVCDSPLLIGLYYNRTFPTNVCNIEKTEAFIKQKMQEFHNVYIFLQRNENHPYETVGRIHNEQESKQIQDDLAQLLKELNLPHLSVKSCKSNIPLIADYALQQANLK